MPNLYDLLYIQKLDDQAGVRYFLLK